MNLVAPYWSSVDTDEFVGCSGVILWSLADVGCGEYGIPYGCVFFYGGIVYVRNYYRLYIAWCIYRDDVDFRLACDQ